MISPGIKNNFKLNSLIANQTDSYYADYPFNFKVYILSFSLAADGVLVSAIGNPH
jgi:hypothetical protein